MYYTGSLLMQQYCKLGYDCNLVSLFLVVKNGRFPFLSFLHLSPSKFVIKERVERDDLSRHCGIFLVPGHMGEIYQGIHQLKIFKNFWDFLMAVLGFDTRQMCLNSLAFGISVTLFQANLI